MRDASALDPLAAEYQAVLRCATDLLDRYLGLRRRGKRPEDIRRQKARGRLAGWGWAPVLPPPPLLARLSPAPAPAQVSVVGVRYGAWGLQRYGAQPTRVDALQFYRWGLQGQGAGGTGGGGGMSKRYCRACRHPPQRPRRGAVAPHLRGAGDGGGPAHPRRLCDVQDARGAGAWGLALGWEGGAWRWLLRRLQPGMLAELTAQPCLPPGASR